MKINCYIALVAAALGCACNPLADTDDMDNNVQATRIAFSPEVVTLDNAGRNAEEDQGQNVIVTLNPKARRSMAWSAETDKTETWCTLTECSVTDADGVTHRGFRITATENTAYKRTATVTLTAAAVQTVISIQHYITDTLLNNILTISGIAVLVAVSVYGALKGLSAVTRSSVFAAVVFGLLIFLIGVTMWDKVNPDFIYPAFIEDGRYFAKLPDGSYEVMNAGKCTLSEISMNSEILIFAVITDEIRSKPHKTVLYYLPLLLVILEFLNLIYNLILGPYMSKIEYPLYIIASLSDIVIFRRLDGIDAIVWLMCGIIKTALIIYCVGRIYSVCSKRPDTKKAVVVYGAFIFMLCMVLGSDRTVYEHFRSIMSYGIHILLGGVLIPLTVLVAGRKKQSGGEKK